MDKKYLKILEDNGFCFNGNGTIRLSGLAFELYNALIKYISKTLEPYYDESLKVSSIIKKDILNKTGYMNNFPQHLIKFDDKLVNLKDYFLTPASCFHVYPLLDNTSVNKKGYLVLSQCGRYEDGKWEAPFRLPSFTMLEVVVFGSEEYIERVRSEILLIVKRLFVKIGLEGDFFTATDAFYLNNNSGAKILQKIKELKKEYRVKIENDDVALMSINKHEKYFSNRFNISLDSKKIAESMCIAFGLERLVAIGLIKWGKDKNKWAKELR
ncbi:MAG: aminoacyl--tRNA ligase-related protein [Candidatus Pacearchaeota archaeon]